jgi:hypothetical protein
VDRVYKRLTLAAQALRYGDQKPRAKRSYGRLGEQEIQEIKRFFPMGKFFIFGHARSGTTLLARLIRVHPQVHCNWQAHFFTRPPFLSSLVSDPEVGDWLSRRSNRWNRGQDLSPVVMRVASDFILENDAARAGKSVVGDKSPNNLVNGEAVLNLVKIYPDAKLIFIVRDGRDAVLSHQIQKFIDLPDHLSAGESAIRQAIIRSPEDFLSKQRSIFTPAGLSKSVHDWVRNVTETNHLGEKFYAENYLSLRFEDLVQDPKISLKQVWNFLGVDPELPGLDEEISRELSANPDAAWQQDQQREVADLIRKGMPGSWREIFTAQDVRSFKDIGGETLIEWGYEENLEW